MASLKLAAQQALDELMEEGLLPFALTVEKLTVISQIQYTIKFDDSRLNSMEVFWIEEDRSFKDVVRATVLDQVSSLSDE